MAGTGSPGACHLLGGRTERLPPVVWGKAGPAEGTAGPELRGRGQPGARGWGVQVSHGGLERLEFNSKSDEKLFGSCQRRNDGI